MHVVAADDALLGAETTRPLIERFVTDPPPDAASAARLRGLTPREREVLVEVARGRSNREIGQALFIGQGTVKAHLAHLLTELGLRDRVQAVVFADESGLVRRGVPPRDGPFRAR